MPVLNNIGITLEPDELERIPGLRCRGLVRKRILAMLPAIVSEINERELVRPALAWDIVEVVRMEGGVVTLQDGSSIAAPLVTHRMGRARRLAFVVATLGEDIGNYIGRLFGRDRQLQAVLTEEIANAWLYRVSEFAHKCIDDEAANTGLQASGPLSPGDEGFPLERQDRVLELAGAQLMGIKLSEHGMMTPRHSVSAVIGLGKRMRRWTQVENCAECAAREHCPHRQTVEALAT